MTNSAPAATSRGLVAPRAPSSAAFWTEGAYTSYTASGQPAPRMRRAMRLPIAPNPSCATRGLLSIQIPTRRDAARIEARPGRRKRASGSDVTVFVQFPERVSLAALHCGAPAADINRAVLRHDHARDRV